MKRIIAQISNFIAEQKCEVKAHESSVPSERNAECYHHGNARGAIFALDLLPKNLYVYSFVKRYTTNDEVTRKTEDLYFEIDDAKAKLRAFVERRVSKGYSEIYRSQDGLDADLLSEANPDKEINIEIVKVKVH
jgi:hypothetical protein